MALHNDPVEFWEKRDVDTLLEYHDPAKVDLALMEDMFRRCRNDCLSAERMLPATRELMKTARTSSGAVPSFVDDWRTVDIKRREDIRDAFVDR